MGRPRHPEALAERTFATKLPHDVAQALEEWATEHAGGNVSEALRMILREQFAGSGLSGLESSLEDAGYNAGMRQGLSESRRLIAKALNGAWRR